MLVSCGLSRDIFCNIGINHLVCGTLFVHCNAPGFTWRRHSREWCPRSGSYNHRCFFLFLVNPWCVKPCLCIPMLQVSPGGGIVESAVQSLAPHDPRCFSFFCVKPIVCETLFVHCNAPGSTWKRHSREWCPRSGPHGTNCPLFKTQISFF